MEIFKFWVYNIFCDKGKLMSDLIEYMDNKINNKTIDVA